MVRDLLGNPLKKGDRIMVELNSPRVFGFIAELVEPPLVAQAHRAAMQPGHILVSVVVPVPVDPSSSQCVAVTRVYDPSGLDQSPEAQEVLAPSESKAN